MELFPDFEMLVVLHGPPVAAPHKSAGGEEAIAEVSLDDLVGEFGFALQVFSPLARLHHYLAAYRPPTRVVERIDVHGQSSGVAREFGASRRDAVVERRGVVGRHRSLVVCAVVVDEAHPLDGVVGVVELAQDLRDVVGNGPIDYHLADDAPALRVFVETEQVAQFLFATRQPSL